MSGYNGKGNKCRTSYNREGEKYKRATSATLDEAGETLLASTKALIQKYDPDGTALKFAFISDLHRSEEGIYTTTAIDDRYSMRLLSRLCDDVDLDAVFCGGDIVNGRDENADYIQKNMGDVVDDFDDLMPYTSIYSNVGNHDKRYRTTRPLNTNEWIGELWSQVQCDGNAVELHYIDDTNFYVDFLKYKVRIIFINQYDDVDSNANWYADENLSSSTGIHTHGTTAWKAAIPTTDKAEWIIGAVIHGADNSNPTNPRIQYWTYTDLSDTLGAYVDSGGKGVLGIFAGHYHISQGCSLNYYSSDNPPISVVHVSCAYAEESQLGTANEYCFSVIVVDTKTWFFREIQVGRTRAGGVIPFTADLGEDGNNGLLENGTATSSYNKYYAIYNGNNVRFEQRFNSLAYGYNLTHLSMQWTSGSTDFVTNDTANVLFSAQAGDVIKTEITFSEDTPTNGRNGRSFKIWSPQIADMVTGYVVTGTTYTKEITLAEAVDVTAIGLHYGGDSGDIQQENQVLAFELNIYKNGVKLTR